jgi:excisionase family DNA binding protein
MLVRNQASMPGLFENSLVWDVDDVARELKCSRRQIRRLVAENSIPYSRVVRLVRFSPHRVHEWLAKGGTR